MELDGGSDEVKKSGDRREKYMVVCSGHIPHLQLKTSFHLSSPYKNFFLKKRSNIVVSPRHDTSIPSPSPTNPVASISRNVKSTT